MTPEELSQKLLLLLPSTYDDLMKTGNGHPLFNRVFDTAINMLFNSGEAAVYDEKIRAVFAGRQRPLPPPTGSEMEISNKVLGALRDINHSERNITGLAEATRFDVALTAQAIARLIQDGRVEYSHGVYRARSPFVQLASAPVSQPAPLLDYIESAKTVVTRVRAILRGFNVTRDNDLDDALDHLERLSENDIVGTDVEELRKEIEKHKEEIEALVGVIENAEYAFDEAGSGLRDTLREYKRRPRR